MFYNTPRVFVHKENLFQDLHLPSPVNYTRKILNYPQKFT